MLSSVNHSTDDSFCNATSNKEKVLLVFKKLALLRELSQNIEDTGSGPAQHVREGVGVNGHLSRLVDAIDHKLTPVSPWASLMPCVVAVGILEAYTSPNT